MTSHEFDAYFDMQPLEALPYHEQIEVMHEFAESHEETLKNEGAIGTLKELHSYLLRNRPVNETDDVTRGLRWATRAIELQIELLDGSFVPLPLIANMKGGVL